MDNKTQGAWLIHHAQKIQGTTNQDFESVSFAGKAAILLSALATSEQSSLPNDKVNSLAKANGIALRTELPTLLRELERQKLVDIGEAGIGVLGVSTQAVIERAAQIFQESNPASHEVASLEVADLVSTQPKREADFLTELQDTYSLTEGETKDFLKTSSVIGFFDSEKLSANEQIYFNGNLFRKDGVKKVTAALDSLTVIERNVMTHRKPAQ